MEAKATPRLLLRWQQRLICDTRVTVSSTTGINALRALQRHHHQTAAERLVPCDPARDNTTRRVPECFLTGEPVASPQMEAISALRWHHFQRYMPLGGRHGRMQRCRQARRKKQKHAHNDKSRQQPPSSPRPPVLPMECAGVTTHRKDSVHPPSPLFAHDPYRPLCVLCCCFLQ